MLVLAFPIAVLALLIVVLYLASLAIATSQPKACDSPSHGIDSALARSRLPDLRARFLFLRCSFPNHKHPKHNVTSPKMSTATPRPRRSARLASETPSVTESTGLSLPPLPNAPALSPSPHPPAPDPSRRQQSLKVAARPQKRAQTQTTAAAFDPRTIITRLRRGDRASTTGLTKAQLEAVVQAYADHDEQQQDRITELESNLRRERDGLTMRRGQYNMKMNEYLRKHEEKKRMEAAATPSSAPAPAESTATAISPRPITPPDAIVSSPAVLNSTSLWGSAMKFLTSSFAKKRRAEDEPAPEEPAQKRQKPIEVAPAESQPTPKRQKPSEPARSAMRQRTTQSAMKQRSTQFAPTVTEQTPSRPAPAAMEPPATAPPRSSFSEQPDATTTTTTAKTPAPTPKRKRLVTTAATPLAAISEASPLEMHTITPRPTRRTIANTRLTQTARKAEPQKPWAWEARPPQARMPNADARIAKIRRAEALRKELAQLEEEEIILRRTKRVKVDHLSEIPHNRPGDSSSTFRVPDIDSDDEMEVLDDIDGRPNIFSASQQQQPASAQQPATQLPLTQPIATNQEQAVTSLPQPPQLPAQQITSSLPPARQQQQAMIPPPQFTFPEVAPRPADYHVLEEYKQAAGELFNAGFAAYCETLQA